MAQNKQPLPWHVVEEQIRKEINWLNLLAARDLKRTP